jgi:hypothetical protein
VFGVFSFFFLFFVGGDFTRPITAFDDERKKRIPMASVVGEQTATPPRARSPQRQHQSPPLSPSSRVWTYTPLREDQVN